MPDILLTSAIVLVCMIAVAATAVRLPGTWVIVAASVALGWWTDWERVGVTLIVVLAVLAVAGEVVELLMSVVTARRAGASRRAAWGGLLGGILGMFFLTFLVPVPLVGTMVGALAGCFAGAMIAELSANRRLAHGTRVGLFSAIGFALGTAAKIAVALAMSGALIVSYLASAPEPAAQAEVSARRSIAAVFFDPVVNESNLVRAGLGAAVLHLDSFDGFRIADQIGRRDAVVDVDEPLDDFVFSG